MEGEDSTRAQESILNWVVEELRATAQSLSGLSVVEVMDGGSRQILEVWRLNVPLIIRIDYSLEIATVKLIPAVLMSDAILKLYLNRGFSGWKGLRDRARELANQSTISFRIY